MSANPNDFSNAVERIRKEYAGVVVCCKCHTVPENPNQMRFTLDQAANKRRRIRCSACRRTYCPQSFVRMAVKQNADIRALYGGMDFLASSEPDNNADTPIDLTGDNDLPLYFPNSQDSSTSVESMDFGNVQGPTPRLSPSVKQEVTVVSDTVVTDPTPVFSPSSVKTYVSVVNPSGPVLAASSITVKTESPVVIPISPVLQVAQPVASPLTGPRLVPRTGLGLASRAGHGSRKRPKVSDNSVPFETLYLIARDKIDHLNRQIDHLAAAYQEINRILDQLASEIEI
jgi:hypothetical protein